MGTEPVRRDGGIAEALASAERTSGGAEEVVWLPLDCDAAILAARCGGEAGGSMVESCAGTSEVS